MSKKWLKDAVCRTVGQAEVSLCATAAAAAAAAASVVVLVVCLSRG